MSFDSEVWTNRADEILSRGGNDHALATEATQFVTSMLTMLHGAGSPQLAQFFEGCASIRKKGDLVTINLRRHAFGAITNCRAEMKAGLIGRLRVQLAGEVLSDLVAMGKEKLAEGNEAGKNVAAVLIAAAFEDLMRRLATEHAGILGRPPMQDIVNALKDAGILKGGTVGVAQSFLKFRNDSLHADWENVSGAQVQSCIGFVEHMLLTHF